MASENRSVALRHLHTVFTAGAIGSLPDGVLLERFLSGRGNPDSSAAFAELVERHGPMVLGVCRDVLLNHHDAEDAAQATFLILAKNGGSIRRVDSLASWLFGVALRVAARSKAAAARRRAIERRGGEMKARSDGGSTESLLPELHEELNRLPQRYRASIVLCHLEGLSNEQAAGQLGLPVRTVQRRLAQGRERLKARLVRRGADPSVGLPATGFTAHPASEAWLEATVRAASGLAAGQEIAAVASSGVTVLTQGVLTMMLIGRLKLAAAGVTAAAALVVALAGAGIAIAARREAVLSGAKIQFGTAAETPPARVGPWIRGLVVDTTGRPVGGARVTSLWTLESPVVTSKEDGTFAIPNNEPRLANLSYLATADGGARQGIFRFDDLTTGPKDPRTLARIVLKPARVVTVTVVDGRGEKVEGAAVSVLDVIFPVAEGRTDSAGRVSLRAPVDALTQWIIGYKSGVGLDYFENYRSVPPNFSPPPESALLVLNGARAVRVRARDSAGKPVPGVDFVPFIVHKRGKLYDVNLCGSSARVRTDEQGVATFDWFPIDVQPGASFALATTSYSMPKWPMLEEGKLDSELTARVIRFTQVAGKVTRPDGSPAAGILVAADGVGPAYPAGSSRARTGADGSYKMALPPNQSYTVYVNDPEWAARSRTGVVVREEQAPPAVDLRLEPGSVIHGRVTAGRAAQPAAGVTVMLFEKGPAVPKGTLIDQPADLSDGATRVADTDSDGRYAFRVGPGEYHLSGPSEPGVNAKSERIKVGDGQDFQRDFKLARLVRPLRMVRGVVRAEKADGPRIAGAIIVVEPIGDRIPPTHGSADDEGRFAVPRPFGAALVYARDPAGNLAGYTTIDADDDGELSIVARPSAVARGRVIDAGGNPLANVRVAFGSYGVNVNLPGGGQGPAGAGQTAMTDQDGRFLAPGLLVGVPCRYFAYDSNGGQSADQSIPVKDAKPIDLGDIVLRRR
jgi:RNA polymerase sigma factor (sigma-70 family)